MDKTTLQQYNELQEMIDTIVTTAKLIGYEINTVINRTNLKSSEKRMRLTLLLSPNKKKIHLLTNTGEFFKDWTNSTHKDKIDCLQEILHSL